METSSMPSDLKSATLTLRPMAADIAAEADAGSGEGVGPGTLDAPGGAPMVPPPLPNMAGLADQAVTSCCAKQEWDNWM